MIRVSCGVLLIVALAVNPSCANLQSALFSRGEVKLLDINIPGTKGDDLPYDVVVTFRAEGHTRIKRACFRWVDEWSYVNQPSLYCYSSEVSDNAPIGSACWRWLEEGPYTYKSPMFCSKVEEIEYGTPSRFTVRLTPRKIEPYYNKLECYVEYEVNGKLKQSNRVGAVIVVPE